MRHSGRSMGGGGDCPPPKKKDGQKNIVNLLNRVWTDGLFVQQSGTNSHEMPWVFMSDLFTEDPNNYIA